MLSSESKLVVNRSGALAVMWFVLLVIIYRLLLPFGDEPDFEVRAWDIVVKEYPWWTPYYWMRSLLSGLDVVSYCRVDAGVMSFWAKIPSEFCRENYSQIALRVLLTIFAVAPLLGIVLFREGTSRLLSGVTGVARAEFELRVKAVMLSLGIPGMVYYLGVLSHEQFGLVLSLIAILFLDVWFIFFLIFLLIALLDVGNAVVLLYFFSLYNVIRFSARVFGFKFGVLLLLGSVAFAYIVGFEILGYVQGVGAIQGKADAMLEKSLGGDFGDKYPIFLRPVITYMTSIFMTPSGLKVVPLYILYGLLSIAVFRRFVVWMRREWSPVERVFDLNANNGWVLATLCGVVSVVSLSFFFPDYSNAKYYMFLAPVFFRFALIVFDFRILFAIIYSSAFFLPFALVLYRL